MRVEGGGTNLKPETWSSTFVASLVEELAASVAFRLLAHPAQHRTLSPIKAAVNRRSSERNGESSLSGIAESTEVDDRQSPQSHRADARFATPASEPFVAGAQRCSG